MQSDNEKNEKRNQIILAALLHDIGKLRQKANISLSASDEIKQLYCKMNIEKGYFTHLHAIHTKEFLDDFLKNKLKNHFSNNDIDYIINLSAKHHNPESNFPEQLIITEADHLSSGTDRREKDEKFYEKDLKFRQIRLRCLFGEISLYEEPKYFAFYKAIKHSPDSYQKPILIERNKFVNEEDFPNEYEAYHTEEEYIELWNEFKNEIDKIEFLNWDQFLSAVKGVIETYTSYVPSSVKDLPFIPLCDHLLNTAAIAAALYDYHYLNNRMYEEFIKNRDEQKFILLGGDISGIQKFIFDFNESNSKWVAKILRARSFLIYAMTKATIYYICEKADISPFCVFSEAAGRFSMIIPNIPEIEQKIQEAYIEIQNWLLKEYLGEVSILINTNTKISSADLLREDSHFTSTWKKFMSNMEEEKKNKFAKIFKSENKWLTDKFIPIDDDLYKKYEAEVDIVTGKLPIEDKSDKISERSNIERELGSKLTNAEILSFIIGNNIIKSSQISFFQNPQIHLNFIENPNYKVKMYTFNINEKTNSNFPTIYISNYIPSIEPKELEILEDFRDEDEEIEVDSPKTFSQIAYSGLEKLNSENNENINKYKGVGYLGILKADVDNLGFIFSEGLENISISEYTKLSRELHFFFSSYLPYYIRKDKNISQKIYTVFAGGDDLFFVGDWKSIWDFSINMQKMLSDHTAKNPNITISAAILFAHPKDPIKMLANNVEELLEDKSKKPDKDSITKGKITICGETIKWDRFEFLTNFAKELDKFANSTNDDEILNSSMLYRLFIFSRDYNDFINGEIKKGLYHSRMRYSISRNIGTIEGLKKEIDECKDEDKKDKLKQKLELLEKLNPIFELINSKYVEDSGGDDIKAVNWLMKHLRIPLTYVIYNNRKRGGK